MKKAITYLLCAVFLLVLLSACNVRDTDVTASPAVTATHTPVVTVSPSATVSPTNSPTATNTPATPTIQAP